MSERTLSPHEAGIYRIQAMQESQIKSLIEILSHLSKKEFKEISEIVWKDINASTKELISMHSHLSGNDTNNPSVN